MCTQPLQRHISGGNPRPPAAARPDPALALRAAAINVFTGVLRERVGPCSSITGPVERLSPKPRRSHRIAPHDTAVCRTRLTQNRQLYPPSARNCYVASIPCCTAQQHRHAVNEAPRRAPRRRNTYLQSAWPPRPVPLSAHNPQARTRQANDWRPTSARLHRRSLNATCSAHMLLHSFAAPEIAWRSICVVVRQSCSLYTVVS